MLYNRRLLTGTAIGVVVACLYSAPALAVGTAAGSTITNSVTVSYEVSGVDQTDETDTDQITVDRKIDLTVARTDSTATNVTPGGSDRAVSFQVTNLSNATLDFDLSAVQPVGGSGAITGTDNFDVGALTYYLDDGDGVYDSGDTLITHLDALPADASKVVHVRTASIALGLHTNDRATVRLTAKARENDSASTLGAALTESASNTSGMDTIFADGAGPFDSARQADYSAADAFLVLTAALSATKTSKIIAIPGGIYEAGAAIPGATVEYCITVSNASGGADATNLTISDDLPAEVEYDGSGVFVGGADCDNPGANTGSETDGTVSGTIATLPAGDDQTLIFRATIQ
jgi:uncharacterized repeat protein (TIGR01451 family)